MSKLHGGSVASAVALMFAAGGVAAAEPTVEQAEVQVMPQGLCTKAELHPQGLCTAAPEPTVQTICGRMEPTVSTMCGRMEPVVPTMCAYATVSEDQPSTWRIIADVADPARAVDTSSAD